MIDALLFAVRNACVNDLAYSVRTNVDVRVDGMPPPGCGDVFLAIHQAGSQQTMSNAKDDYYAFDLTLTYRITVPLDRIGDRELASQLARLPGPKGSISLNNRLDILSNYFHMAWGVIGDANNLMAGWTPNVFVLWGFAEPPRYKNTELPRFENGTWFGADAAAEQVGLVGQLHFDDCRRLQPLTTFA